jgi:catechol 2,3-dioxygenase-like lactoylglutathione lyase family enzyme
MLDHIILTVSDVERSLAFYEAALKPLNIKFFMPYKGKDGHPDLWGFGDGKRAFFWMKAGGPHLDNCKMRVPHISILRCGHSRHARTPRFEPITGFSFLHSKYLSRRPFSP